MAWLREAAAGRVSPPRRQNPTPGRTTAAFSHANVKTASTSAPPSIVRCGTNPVSVSSAAVPGCYPRRVPTPATRACGSVFLRVGISMPFGRRPRSAAARVEDFGGVAGPRPITSPTCFFGRRAVFVVLLAAGFAVFAVVAGFVRLTGAALRVVAFARFDAGAVLRAVDVVVRAAVEALRLATAPRTGLLRTGIGVS
jgi:hypothetical protein